MAPCFLFCFPNVFCIFQPEGSLKRCFSFQDCRANYHELGGLKQQKFLLSSFWRPEVWNQGVSRAAPEALGKDTVPQTPTVSCLRVPVGSSAHSFDKQWSIPWQKEGQAWCKSWLFRIVMRKTQSEQCPGPGEVGPVRQERVRILFSLWWKITEGFDQGANDFHLYFTKVSLA